MASSSKRLQTYFLALICIGEGIFLIILGSFFLGNFLGGFIILGIPGLLVILYAVFVGAIELREYSVDENGIKVRYFKKVQVYHSWSEVSNIYVCDVNHAPKNGRVFDLVIRIVIGRELHGPLSTVQPKTMVAMIEKWRTPDYTISNFYDIILVEYSKERLDEIQKLSGQEILYFLTPLGKEKLQSL